MAQSIRNLALGSQIKDSKGTRYTVVAKDHYAPNEVTLKANVRISKLIQSNTNVVDYGASDLSYWLNTEFSKTIDTELASYISVTKLPYCDVYTKLNSELKYANVKFFLPSLKELGTVYSGTPEANAGVIRHMPYFNSNTSRVHPARYWTRTEYQPAITGELQGTFYVMNKDGTVYYPTVASATNEITPFFNVSANLLVADTVQGGDYTFIFNNPPVLSIIGNIVGNYGTPTTIEYTATDVDNSVLKHYFSSDAGETWSEINPTRIGDTYKYNHIFKELINYNCRLKVVDTADNQVVSNLFIVSVNSSAPSISIVSVVDKIVTYKVNCTTDIITKVEILINGSIKQTLTSGFDFNLKYEINRSDLNIGVNTIQIRATSSANIVGTRSMEANKKAYSIPPVGTKLIIHGQEYSIVSSTQNGTNQTYTLNKNLMSTVSIGDAIQAMQDFVNVKCSLSNASTHKDYKAMKLVKTKILKGTFAGYIEEKYELEGEGRYSTVMLELNRFNNEVASELIELQQAFDYLED